MNLCKRQTLILIVSFLGILVHKKRAVIEFESAKCAFEAHRKVGSMELTAAAACITSVFAGFDYQILSLFHQLELMAGSILTPLAQVITLVGEKGAIFLLAGIICLFFKRTRRMGFGIILAIAICFVINNLFIKDFVCRPRPFEYSDTFNSWWIAAGAYPEDSYSFPSGHVAAAAAAMMVYLMHRRHFLNFLFALLVVLLMGSSRMYLMGHYPSDVLGGILVGVVAGLLGYGIVQLIWNAVWKKRGGAQALQNAGYRPNRGTQFEIPMGAPKPSRAQGTSPFAAEALNDPMNFSAGGAIATNSSTMSFRAVPDQSQYPDTYQPAGNQQGYQGGYQDGFQQGGYQAGYQGDFGQSRQASQTYPGAQQSYTPAAQTAAFQAYYGNTEYAHSGKTAELNTASTTEFSAYLHPENKQSNSPAGNTGNNSSLNGSGFVRASNQNAQAYSRQNYKARNRKDK